MGIGIYAMVLIIMYCITFLGACSPLYCRLFISIVGMVCIGLSIFGGLFIGTMLGYVPNETNNALPILMLGIGVDDMFVICNALD